MREDSVKVWRYIGVHMELTNQTKQPSLSGPAHASKMPCGRWHKRREGQFLKQLEESSKNQPGTRSSTIFASTRVQAALNEKLGERKDGVPQEVTVVGPLGAAAERRRVLLRAAGGRTGWRSPTPYEDDRASRQGVMSLAVDINLRSCLRIASWERHSCFFSWLGCIKCNIMQLLTALNY